LERFRNKGLQKTYVKATVKPVVHRKIAVSQSLTIFARQF